VAHLYDPVEFELQGDRRSIARERRAVRELTAFQLRFADAVTCGSGAQMERLEEALAASARSDGGPRLACVPFGVPPPPPEHTHRPGRLRELFESIASDDVVALWWGSVWHWLDAETPLRAMKRLSELEPRLKLVLSVGPPPGPEARRLTRTDEMRELAQELGLFGETVFFLEDWIPYRNRSEILTDADIGITFHRDPSEAAVAVRARYLDFVWCSLPTVLTPGDELGNELVDRGAAVPVSSGDVESAADALLTLARDPDLRRSAARAAAAVARERPWSTVVGPLVETLQEVMASSERADQPHRELLSATLRYYLSRMRDKLVSPFSREAGGAPE
jgi:glycosyltransferase involved in cell wall biosynthesis